MADAGALVPTTDGQCETYGSGPPLVAQNQNVSMIGAGEREHAASHKGLVQEYYGESEGGERESVEREVRKVGLKCDVVTGRDRKYSTSPRSRSLCNHVTISVSV
jgi:hypothetical protein